MERQLEKHEWIQSIFEAAHGGEKREFRGQELYTLQAIALIEKRFKRKFCAYPGYLSIDFYSEDEMFSAEVKRSTWLPKALNRTSGGCAISWTKYEAAIIAAKFHNDFFFVQIFNDSKVYFLRLSELRKLLFEKRFKYKKIDDDDCWCIPTDAWTPLGVIKYKFAEEARKAKKSR